MARTPDVTEIIRFLEERNALILNRPRDEQPWPSVTDGDVLSPVDYDVMFPTDLGENTNLADNDALNENLPGELVDLAGGLLGGAGDIQGGPGLGGELTADTDDSVFDVLAWYQPIRFTERAGAYSLNRKR